MTIPGSSDEDFDDHQHPHGNPVNLMWLTQNQSIEVDYDSIDKMFLHPEIADRTIVAISIIGAFRKGKSFLMDYCLRFMYANVSLKYFEIVEMKEFNLFNLTNLVQVNQLHGQQSEK